MFNTRIEEHLVAGAYRSKERTSSRHWPSEASCIRKDSTVVGKCIREQYFITKGYEVEKSIAAHFVRKWDMGKSIEQNEIRYAKEIGMWVDDDVSFLLDLGDIQISGKLDAIYTDMNGDKVCVEYKTSEGYRFEQAVYGKYSRLRAMPKPEHILQVMLYLEAFKDLKYADIFYINRGKLDVIEHIVKVVDGTAVVNGEETDLTLDGIYSRYRKLTKYLDSDTIPPCDFCPEYSEDTDMKELQGNGLISKASYDDWLKNDALPGHWRCRSWCGYRNICLKMRKDAPSSQPSDEDSDPTPQGAILEL